VVCYFVKVTTEEFARARRPEQVEARRAAILAVAQEMLAERPVAEISLRELSDRVGLAKSNVLRYFDSREAIFLEVFDRVRDQWLDDLERDLPAATEPATPAAGGYRRETASATPAADGNRRKTEPATPAAGGYRREAEVATAIAASLLRNPLLCELMAATAGVLERNIPVDFARSFKVRASTHATRLADLVRKELPSLSPTGASHFAGAIFVITAGLWPYARPTAAVVQVMTEMGVPGPATMFERGLTDGLINHLIGTVARGM
jgi:AcrR family transcriptional regulator